MMLRTIAVALGVAIGTLCTPVHAANLVVNPDFNAGIGSWTPSVNGGTVAWSAGFGNPAGSISTNSPAPNTSALATQCVAISAPATVDFIVDGYASLSTVSGGFVISATAYTGTDCTGTNLGDLPGGSESFPPGGWQGFQIALVSQQLPASTNSVLLTIGSSTGPTAGSIDDYFFDNIRFGPAGTTPVTLQSFEVD
jgi:hypothetical protein